MKKLYNELRMINDIIDRRIVRGRPYRREALRHKFLLSQIRKLERRSSSFIFRSYPLTSNI
ncbi:MAG: hypothetical protein HYT43_01540 [Candidatus Taylorbacteria bacterium]|nr:hypothetical protein [Candidatus Taylorbacteria bacterium]